MRPGSLDEYRREHRSNGQSRRRTDHDQSLRKVEEDSSTLGERGFQTWRRVVLVILVLVFYVNPWLSWNGDPGVRFDLVHRRFTVFWTTFVPEEFVLLAWLLLIAALVLFTVTIAAGRVFAAGLARKRSGPSSTLRSSASSRAIGMRVYVSIAAVGPATGSCERL